MSETVGQLIENWLRKHHWNPIFTYFGIVAGFVCIGLAVGYSMTNKHVYAASICFFVSFVLLLGGGWHAWKVSHRIKWICTAAATVIFAFGDYFWIKSMNQPVPWLLIYINSHLPWVLVFVFGLLFLAALRARPRQPEKLVSASTENSSTNSGIPTLSERVGALAGELLQFLQEKGPAPKVEGPDVWSSLRDAIAVNSQRLPNIHDGYMSRFHDRVDKLIYELGDNGIRDYALNDLVNKQTHSDKDIQAIADKLLALGSSIITQDYRHKHEPTIVTKIDDSSLLKIMPRPYLEVEDSVIGNAWGKTAFKFTNHGGEVAHKVQVQSLSIDNRLITFDVISVIPVGQEKRTLPNVPGGIGALHDILSPMEKEWERALLRDGGPEEENGEWTADIRATYEDHLQRRFETTMILVVFPVERTRRNKNALQNPTREYKTVDVRNQQFRPIQ